MEYHYYENRKNLIDAYQCDAFTWLPHMHVNMEIIFIREGTMEIQVDNERKFVSAGEAVVVFPNALHSFNNHDKPALLDIAICSPPLFKEYHQALTNFRPVNPFISAENLHPDVLYAIQALQKENTDPTLSVCSAFFSLIMARILPVLSLQQRAKASSNQLTYKAISYLMANFQNPLSLESVAEALGVSKYNLSRIFTSHFQTTFTNYVHQLRINHAKELLRSTDVSIQHICFECGFENLRSFERVFHASCRMTPRDFRKARSG